MTLHVRTARIGAKGLTDALDITRKSATGDGLAFAPSGALLWPTVAEMKRADELRLKAETLAVQHEGTVALARCWWGYVASYAAEMKANRQRDPEPWGRLLSRESVTLLCYCTDPNRCHRTLLGAMLLPRMGAVYEGEVRT